jgi:hypothetical protein
MGLKSIVKWALLGAVAHAEAAAAEPSTAMKDYIAAASKCNKEFGAKMKAYPKRVQKEVMKWMMRTMMPLLNTANSNMQLTKTDKAFYVAGCKSKKDEMKRKYCEAMVGQLPEGKVTYMNNKALAALSAMYFLSND